MKNKSRLFTLLFFSVFVQPIILAQTATEIKSKPKLVIGLVIDQMRNDYIYRYWNRYGNGGFKRLINKGFYFRNAHYNYVPTYTGPGHCSIYTGTTPRQHGIIANDWFDKTTSRMVYCASDTSVRTVGSEGKAGLMSPKNQLSSTIGDEMKMTTQQKAKVIAVALKDRSAILPAGHAADAAYWYDDISGHFISSTWYLNQLPNWLNEFNSKEWAKTYLEKGWQTFYPIETYTNSIQDDNRYEQAPNKKEKPEFPYDYKLALEKKYWAILKATPYGNTITKDLAISAITNEQLGKDNITDLLSISFSSPDIIGHSYGPRAVEMEDMYIRLDKDLEDLLNFLDKEIGKNEYTIFLTADHGGADVPNHLTDNQITAGYVNENKISQYLKELLQQTYGDSLILASVSNEQIFIDEKRLSEKKIPQETIENYITTHLLKLDGIAEVYSSATLKNNYFALGDYRYLIQNGYNQKKSGHLAFVYQPAWMDYAPRGTTHGAGYNYDTHIPIIFYGKGIPAGYYDRYVSITQIAPTVCELLKINRPNSCFSEPLNFLFK